MDMGPRPGNGVSFLPVWKVSLSAQPIPVRGFLTLFESHRASLPSFVHKPAFSCIPHVGTSSTLHLILTPDPSRLKCYHCILWDQDQDQEVPRGQTLGRHHS